jgi:uncharacterized YccA/Bax inhibitor family protein
MNIINPNQVTYNQVYRIYSTLNIAIVFMFVFGFFIIISSFFLALIIKPISIIAGFILIIIGFIYKYKLKHSINRTYGISINKLVDNKESNRIIERDIV